MKKVIIVAIALTFAGYSNATSVNHRNTLITAEDTRTPIKIEDLPEAVKKTLSSTAYEGWTAVSAYLVEGTGISYYEVTMTKDAEKKYVKLDKEGNSVK